MKKNEYSSEWSCLDELMKYEFPCNRRDLYDASLSNTTIAISE
jgi:hypothetical protein